MSIFSFKTKYSFSFSFWYQKSCKTDDTRLEFPQDMWEQLFFCGAREVFGVSLRCAKGTEFVSSWLQLWTDPILLWWTWPTDLDAVMLLDKFCMHGVESHRLTLCYTRCIHVLQQCYNLIIIQQKFIEA